MRGRLQVSKRLGQTRLTKDCIGSVATRNADRHGEISFRDRAMPNFVAAVALPHENATRGTQQIAQRLIKLRRHSGCGRLGFAQRGDLQE